jgi:prepilin-type N-terminal cleavage/methylation domain-containing protein
MRRRGFTLVEVAVAVAVLATAGVALERLVARSIGTIDHDVARIRTLAIARLRLAEAAVVPPPPGRASWPEPGDFRTTREVAATAHPALRKVTIRVERAGGGDASELVELIYAPAS